MTEFAEGGIIDPADSGGEIPAFLSGGCVYLLPAQDTETDDGEPEGFTCPPCQRTQHTRCRSAECTCCGEDQGG